MSNQKISNRKLDKQSLNLKNKVNRNNNQKKASFGICFDVDGVLARGTLPIPAAIKAIKLLQDDKGDVKVPITYVTNALNRNIDKANQISEWLGIPVRPDQVCQSTNPIVLFKDILHYHTLVLGQDRLDDIARELGFTNYCTVEDVAEAYPLLDMIDHDNRKRVAKEGFVAKDLDRIEAVVLLGEPKKWESPLQLLVDVLKTDGKPDKPPAAIPETHLPVIACNMDLQFMDRAVMPRYGHGAFLVCLEALYKKVTGFDLKYTALIGKPSEITFRYAEHCLSREAKLLGIEEPLKTMYLIGDTPEVDIAGANLYQRYIDRYRTRVSNNEISDQNDKKDNQMYDPELPQSRNIPSGTVFSKQSVEECCGVLVATGVYKPGVDSLTDGDEKCYHGHRDFPNIPELKKPTKICDDVYKAIEYILEREQICFQ